MPNTEVKIDETMIEEGLKIAGVKTQKELFQIALKDYVERYKRKKMLELEGKVKWEGNLDEIRESRF